MDKFEVRVCYIVPRYFFELGFGVVCDFLLAEALTPIVKQGQKLVALGIWVLQLISEPCGLVEPKLLPAVYTSLV